MNYIIWKNKDSRTLKGLIISELPSITKPRMRVQETEVDGVDGSIIEELGYESYDKTLQIGLSRNFDIDEIIEYFSGAGQVVFSNEPDKYYNARIVDQVDYERLLRFRTASITLRVQPFKYKYLEEETRTEEKSVEGTNIQITNGIITRIKMEVNAQEGETPILTNKIKITSKNLFNTEEFAKLPSTYYEYNSSTNDLTILINDGRSWSGLDSLKIPVKPNITYYFKCEGNATVQFGLYNYNDEFIQSVNIKNGNTYTIPNNTQYIRIKILAISGTYPLTISKILLCEDIITDKDYEPYKEEIINVDLVGHETIQLEGQDIPVINGTLNISNENNENMIVNYIENNLIVNNNGNYISKPIITITGSGPIEFTVNGNTLFRYTFPDGEDTVVIDSQKQDAYIGTILKNRNMSGEFPIFKVGENIITWDGSITNIEISSKSRWL